MQYAIAFGLIATMLMIAGFPMFVIFFFGIFAYFLWKTFSQPSRGGTREIFEFYLSANEVLRDDERRWFGFEVQEIINRGERILQVMNGAPPLVYFTLGALYNRVGDHKSAVSHLSYIVENDNADESNYVYATPELRNYTRILRKIEREPAEAPQTSAAIRALERARRNRAKTILEASREGVLLLDSKKEKAMLEQKNQIEKLAEINHANHTAPKSIVDDTPEKPESNGSQKVAAKPLPNNGARSAVSKNNRPNEENFANRKPISEVLQEIYDK